jgi:cyclic beta-1,2-glucan synthetase
VFRYRGARNVTCFEIAVENPHRVSRGVAEAELDGVLIAKGAPIRLADDGGAHRIRLVLGDAATVARAKRKELV